MVGHRHRSRNRVELLAAEQTRLRPRQGLLRVGLGYPSTYHVAMSSLAWQWVTEITCCQPDTAVERFVAEPGLAGQTLETATPLGELHVLAWSCSFEPDAVDLMRTLDAAHIPRRATARGPRHPLLVLGGAVAAINPLPLAPGIDVFCLGAAELVWPQLLELVRTLPDRDQLLARLADLDGFFVPRFHLDDQGRPRRRCRRLEKHDSHFKVSESTLVPASHIVTPHTEYANRALVEVSRGCPEKCRFCWVSHGSGRLRTYPTEAILDRLDELSSLTRRVGLVAAAMGDHPQLAAILDHCRRSDLSVALSSLRIPAMVPEILTPLAACGARSITIAPETGRDPLRHRLGKAISNQQILQAVETAQACGISGLKMYFVIGLPEESDEDILAIADLVLEARQIMLTWGRSRGRLAPVHVGINVLVPKPYTPYRRLAMIDSREARRRLAVIERRLGRTSNIRLDRPSYRQALWQGYLSRGDTSAFDLLGQVASGEPLSRVLRLHRAAVEAVCLTPPTSPPLWQFISTAPRPESTASATGEM